MSRPLHSPTPAAETLSVTDPNTGLRLFVRHWLPQTSGGRTARSSPVLYVHGATFPSALSVAFPFEGRSWANDLAARGLDLWAFDFLGFGHSDRYPVGRSDDVPGRAERAVSQIGAVVDAILRHTGPGSIALLAHSWGTVPAGLFAARFPQGISRLAFFGPITDRNGPVVPLPGKPFLDVTLDWQADRFQSEVPDGEPPAFVPHHWDPWSEAYLETDPHSLQRVPPSVRVPTGPFADIQAAHAGSLAYDPAGLRAPLLLVRGAWDTLCTAADVAHLRDRATGVPSCAVITLPRGSHVMHLETGRFRLYDTVGRFLTDDGPEPTQERGIPE